MSEIITNEELARRIDSGVSTFKDEIKQVHRRLDGQARTLNEHAVKLAVHEVHAAAAPAQKTGDDTKAITRWDLTVFAAGVYLLLEVLPKMRALLGQ